MRPLLLALTFCLPALLVAQPEEQPRTFEMADGDTTYVMKRYVLVLLMRGDQADAYSEAELQTLQAGHMANINRMAEEGILLMAGPTGEETDTLRGIFLLDVGNIDAARAQVDTDPAVQAGRLKAEYHTWWGAQGATLK